MWVCDPSKRELPSGVAFTRGIGWELTKVWVRYWLPQYPSLRSRLDTPPGRGFPGIAEIHSITFQPSMWHLCPSEFCRWNFPFWIGGRNFRSGGCNFILKIEISYLEMKCGQLASNQGMKGHKWIGGEVPYFGEWIVCMWMFRWWSTSVGGQWVEGWKVLFRFNQLWWLCLESASFKPTL